MQTVCGCSQFIKRHHGRNGRLLCCLLLQLVLLPLRQTFLALPTQRSCFSVVALCDVMLNPCLTALLFFLEGGLNQLLFPLGGHRLATTSGLGQLGNEDQSEQEDDGTAHVDQRVVSGSEQ